MSSQDVAAGKTIFSVCLFVCLIIFIFNYIKNEHNPLPFVFNMTIKYKIVDFVPLLLFLLDMRVFFAAFLFSQVFWFLFVLLYRTRNMIDCTYAKFCHF